MQRFTNLNIRVNDEVVKMPALASAHFESDFLLAYVWGAGEVNRFFHGEHSILPGLVDHLPNRR